MEVVVQLPCKSLAFDLRAAAGLHLSQISKITMQTIKLKSEFSYSANDSN